jgi:predicted RecB family nuclease
MRITSSLFAAFLKCPTKCWLRSQGEEGTGNAYSDWMRTQNESYLKAGMKRLAEGFSCDETIISSTEPVNLKTAKWRLGVEFVARTEDLESCLNAVECVPSAGRGKVAQLIPYRFVFNNKITKNDKLLVAFDTIVLSEMLGCMVDRGKIVHGDDHATLKVKTSILDGEVRKLIGKIAPLLSNQSLPTLALNRHCTECEFQARCRQTAIGQDDLSLLAGMKEKELKKYHSKGIFTVTQLSYTFRPRRRPKRWRDKRERYHHSLKALAIREKKIHIVGSPELKIEGTPVYLDVEGLPDRDFYYLIGVRVRNGDSVMQHSLWSDSVEDEKKIWDEFLGIIATIENPVLVHYGSFESIFLSRMSERYGGLDNKSPVAPAIGKSLNLLSLAFGRIYFPGYTNGLKEVARFLGFDWSEPNVSGIQTVIWRTEWEHSRDPSLKHKLTTYNAEDCEALCRVTECLRNCLAFQTATSDRHAIDVVNTDSLPRERPFIFRRNQFQLTELEEINRAAYWNYQREKILLKTERRLRITQKTSTQKERVKLPVNKALSLPPSLLCPRCGSSKFYKHWATKKDVVDVRFGRSGIKRWITRFSFYHYRCPSCHAVFHNPERAWTNSKYGPNLRAFSVYLNIDLGVPQRKVAAFLNDIFGFNFSLGVTNKFKANLATFYKPTYDRLVQKIVRGRTVHADETRVNISGNIGYVWIFTSLEEAVYIYAPSRDGDLVVNLLRDFKGVLISDFYAAYDSLDCPQQKCLVHLIRDMNNDLLKEPFNEEMKSLVADFAGLVKPMIETVDRFGLKARFLRKHKANVDRFFKRLSRQSHQTDIAAKCKVRLEKNHTRLFTFLDYDGVPWNNNNAEHAVKPFALLRRDFAGITTENGICDYLILLSLCETCRFKGVSFLGFLRSGGKDIDAYAETVRRSRSRSW